jgi:hypothetical protein
MLASVAMAENAHESKFCSTQFVDSSFASQICRLKVIPTLTSERLCGAARRGGAELRLQRLKKILFRAFLHDDEMPFPLGSRVFMVDFS